ncbi:MAG: hypothetical protein QF475_03825 [Candidatus Undinarchaeales archaeon]|nr:hypothetical protein [Candidatus Undinarchaeales archaeon]
MAKKGQSTKKLYLGMEKNKAIILAMALVMVVSMGAGIASSLIEDDDSDIEQVSMAQVIIDFGNYSRVTEVVEIGTGDNAYQLFNKVGTVTQDFLNNGFVVTKIDAGEYSAENAGNYTWLFYVNGKLNLDSPDYYTPTQGDYLELRYGVNPF